MIRVTTSGPVRLRVQPSGEHLGDPELHKAMATWLGPDCWWDLPSQIWYVRRARLARCRWVLSPWAACTVWSGVDPGPADTGPREAPRRGPAALTSDTWAEALLTAVGDSRATWCFARCPRSCTRTPAPVTRN